MEFDTAKCLQALLRSFSAPSFCAALDGLWCMLEGRVRVPRGLSSPASLVGWPKACSFPTSWPVASRVDLCSRCLTGYCVVLGCAAVAILQFCNSSTPMPAACKTRPACCRPRASAPLTTSAWPAPGSSTVATWTTSQTTCSSAHSTLRTTRWAAWLSRILQSAAPPVWSRWALLAGVGTACRFSACTAIMF